MKWYYKIVIAMGLSTNCAFGMAPTIEDSESKLSIRVINVNLKQLPNDGDSVNMLILSHKDQVKDIVPLPKVSEQYTFSIPATDFWMDKKIQLGQLDNGHHGIHSDISWPIEVTNTSILFSNYLTLTIQDNGTLFKNRSGSYCYEKWPTKIDFIVKGECEVNLLNLVVSLIGSGKLINESYESSKENLCLLSMFLHKFYPPIQIELQNKDLNIDLNPESRALMGKHKTIEAWRQ
ncbi:MAG: hypothetical protein H0X26_00410 [Alphaproteobacteria bacterium]|nr:hypothetical protein [Alphaproteobacteria bacterium]